MKVFDNVDIREWQGIADRCGYATFFHTPAWSRAFAKTYPGISIATKKFVFEDGTRVIFPLVKRKIAKRLLYLYVSNAAGVYGGWISEKALSEEQAGSIFEWVNSRLKNYVWRANPFAPVREKTVMQVARHDFTQYLDLRKGFEHIRGSWAKSHASASITRQVRRALREGITVREAVSFREWKDYFAIYETSLERWGDKATSRYPFTLFENFFNGCRGSARLWLAFFGNIPVSGALCFYNNRHAAYWHGAGLEEFFPKRPAHLLHYEIIKDACEKGYRWYDLNPSGGHEGVVKFKKSFGAEKAGSDVMCGNSSLFKLIDKMEKYFVELTGCRK